MNWRNVKLIFLREVRDQLRDRRTLFMIAVLPLLLYPLLAMSFFQVAQVIRERPSRVLVLSEADLPENPALLEAENTHFAGKLFDRKEQQELLQLRIPHDQPWEKTGETPADFARQSIRQGDYEVVVLFPADFTERLEKYRADLKAKKELQTTGDMPPVPSPAIYHNSAQEKSQIAYSRVLEAMRHWTDLISEQNLRDQQVPPEAMKSVQFESTDVAEEGHRDAAVWSKILPFVLMIWALTGAFYPAVDLCAGEKERGTLETLLSSPARRSEIVCGKLLTVMAFSMATSLLNLACMGATGMFVISQMQGLQHGVTLRHTLGPPPAWAPLWLSLALVPISALFSALCLAVAAFARSTKEGQYYLMPLIMVILPLMILPMASGGELDLGQSLIPVSGVVLLLKTVLEGNLQQALPYVLPVTIVTLGCCVFAIRWAVEQFNKESVLFREGERFNLALYVRRLVSDREELPSPGESLFCGAIILVIGFFINMAFTKAALVSDGKQFVRMILIPQLSAILTPTLIMAVMLARRPAAALALRWPRWWTIPAMVLLALLLQPTAQVCSELIQKLYPLQLKADDPSAGFMKSIVELPIEVVILLMALTPAICEELAFRGFVLSGLRSQGNIGIAIFVSSLFFAFAHPVVPQQVFVFFLGLLLGAFCVRLNSLLPGIFFHFTHNAMAVLFHRYGKWLYDFATEWQLTWLVSIDTPNKVEYTSGTTIATALLSAGLIVLLWKYGRPKSTASDAPGSMILLNSATLANH